MDFDSGSQVDSSDGLDVVEHDDLVEIRSSRVRQAVSSGEPSLDGSIDVDEERGALSDSDIVHAARSNTIAAQVKGPSSDALEEECRMEHASREAEWEDVLGSGQLKRKVLVAGSGQEHDRPTDGQWVTIRVKDMLRGKDSHERIHFVTGYSMVIDAWELVVKLMHLGETCVIKTSSVLAYGANGLEDKIPPDEDQEYRIELLEVENCPAFTDMSEDHLYQFILTLKDRGKFYYTRNEYDKAVFVYKRASSIPFDEDSERLRNLMSTIHSNLSMCFFKLADYSAVLNSVDDSLRLNPNNVKALFRKAMTLAEKNDFEEAVEVLKKAARVDPVDMAISSELQRLSGLRRRRHQDERSLYRKMLSGAGDDVKKGDTLWSWFIQKPSRVVMSIFFLVMFVFFIYFLSQV